MHERRQAILDFLKDSPGWHTVKAIASVVGSKPQNVNNKCSAMSLGKNPRLLHRVEKGKNEYSINPGYKESVNVVNSRRSPNQTIRINLTLSPQTIAKAKAIGPTISAAIDKVFEEINYGTRNY